MRWNATRRPPASTTAALTLMLSCFALAKVASSTRLASSSVRAIDSSLLELMNSARETDYSGSAAAVNRRSLVLARGTAGRPRHLLSGSLAMEGHRVGFHPPAARLGAAPAEHQPHHDRAPVPGAWHRQGARFPTPRDA